MHCLKTAGVAHPNALQFKSVDLTGSSIGTSVGFQVAPPTLPKFLVALLVLDDLDLYFVVLVWFELCSRLAPARPPARPPVRPPACLSVCRSVCLPAFSLKHNEESMSSVGTSAYVDVHVKTRRAIDGYFSTRFQPRVCSRLRRRCISFRLKPSGT